jgi:hypothetical protein
MTDPSFVAGTLFSGHSGSLTKSEWVRPSSLCHRDCGSLEGFQNRYSEMSNGCTNWRYILEILNPSKRGWGQRVQWCEQMLAQQRRGWAAVSCLVEMLPSTLVVMLA